MFTGYSPRRRTPGAYVMPGFGHFDKLMSQLGKCNIGWSGLYIRRFADVDETALERLIQDSVEYMRQHYDTR